MYVMAGASLNQARLVRNIGGNLWNRLQGRGCEVFMADLRLQIAASGLYTYPDVMVICGTPEHPVAAVDIVANPKLTVEVLSDSTKNYHRGEKFRH
jgi:Uma2 family endonuclease